MGGEGEEESGINWVDQGQAFFTVLQGRSNRIGTSSQKQVLSASAMICDDRTLVKTESYLTT